MGKILFILFTLALFFVVLSLRALTVTPCDFDLHGEVKSDLIDDVASSFRSIAPLETLTAHLQAAVRIDTISHEDCEQFDHAKFSEFLRFLEKTYSEVFSTFEVTKVGAKVGEYSLMMKWKGSSDKDASMPPILLCAHMDVVPIDNATKNEWTETPFSGNVKSEGHARFMYGRGTLDDKGALISVLESATALIKSGFKPTRSIYFAFGHDEEVSGWKGAFELQKALQKQLKASNQKQFAFVLDEGLPLAIDMIEGLPSGSIVAMIGVVEKGWANWRLKVRGRGGHSSMPPVDEMSVINRLGQAINRLESSPMPANLGGIFDRMLGCLCPFMTFGQRFVVANRDLFSPLISYLFTHAGGAQAAQVRTTIAVTMFNAGIKANVLAAEASATVNTRIHPSNKVEDVRRHIVGVVNDKLVSVEALDELEASPVSPVDAPPFRMLSTVIHSIWSKAIVTPAVVTGNTDTRHYWQLSRSIFRFMPLLFRKDDVPRIHGINERIELENLHRMVEFYTSLIHSTKYL